ncbi:hypothetical protein [Thermosulfurimonas sp. F29]|uniref:hypothetical protein n=1 Tax=Thermosulfurimonas sp. F29 TaxID=2867247 RepID=UPI001C833ADB|nr:hypothetical protein [Thermosulfurimonas sp. F29]MBX6423809.1 hypothetical protein [Thermosulfurimonas sp. F29]
MSDRKKKTGLQKDADFDLDWFDWLFPMPGHVPNPRGVDPDEAFRDENENRNKNETEQVEVGNRNDAKTKPSPPPLKERVVIKRIPARVDAPWDDDAFLDAIADAVASAVLDEAVRLREEAETRKGMARVGKEK